MSGHLAPVQGYVLDLATGELVSLAAASDDALAALRESLTELAHERTTALAQVDDELVRRTDDANRAGILRGHTYVTAGGYKVAVEVTGRPKVDAESLRRDAIAMVQEGEVDLAQEAVEQAFAPRGLVLVRNRWNTLLKLAPELEALEARHTTRDRRHARVERTPQLAVNATAEDIS
jgi:hypothetical protein